MSGLADKIKIINSQQEKIDELEAQLVELKCQASLTNKQGKKKKRKAHKVEKKRQAVNIPDQEAGQLTTQPPSGAFESLGDGKIN